MSIQWCILWVVVKSKSSKRAQKKINKSGSVSGPGSWGTEGRYTWGGTEGKAKTYLSKALLNKVADKVRPTYIGNRNNT